VAKLKNGEFQFVVLSKSDIKAIQLMSKYTNDLYFNDKKDPMNWMIKKVAIMQLSKLLPKDYHGKQAVEMNNQLEGGAMLTLDEDNKVVIVDGKRIAATRQSTMAGINELPDIPE
jgi:recombinational DNA repair protein RecT